MAKTASEAELAGLHALLAQVMAAQVGQTEEFINVEGEMEVHYTASPALLAIAAKFLKDNQITTVIEDDTNLNNLQEILSNKTKRGRLQLASVTTLPEANEA